MQIEHDKNGKSRKTLGEFSGRRVKSSRVYLDRLAQYPVNVCSIDVYDMSVSYKLTLGTR